MSSTLDGSGLIGGHRNLGFLKRKHVVFVHERIESLDDRLSDDFLDIVLRYRAQWFSNPIHIRECCDPAGAADTSHGTAGAVKTLREKGIHPVYIEDSNSPAIRLAMVERMAGQMRKRSADRAEAFAINADSEMWLTISEKATVPDRFLADGFEAGYVWDEHTVSVGNKQVRRPKKDGWYEHGQNCAEYLELNFGAGLKTKSERDADEEERRRRTPTVPYRPASAWS